MRRVAQALVRLYPRPWRDRYGAELLALLDELDVRAGDLLGLLTAALAAHFALWKERDEMKTIPRKAVLTLLMGTFGIFLVLALSGVLSEGAQEFLLVLAPLLVIPAMGPLATTYPPDWPRLNAAVRALGLVSGAAAAGLALVSVAVSVLRSDPNVPVPILSAAFFLALSGLALWFIVNGWLGWRGGQLPGGLALLSILFGLTSLVVFATSNGATQAALPRASYTRMMNLVTPLWLLCGMVWMGWTAGWLWRTAAGNLGAQGS